MSELPVCNLQLTIQHERWAADRWTVFVGKGINKFAIGSPCETLELAHNLRDSFKSLLREIQMDAAMAPATAAGSCDGCVNLKGEKKCFNCVRSAYVMDNYEAAK